MATIGETQLRPPWGPLPRIPFFKTCVEYHDEGMKGQQNLFINIYTSCLLTKRSKLAVRKTDRPRK